MSWPIRHYRLATVSRTPLHNHAGWSTAERIPAIRLLGGAPSPSHNTRNGWMLVALTTMIIVGWLVVVLLSDPVRFVVFNPRGKTGFEMFLALGQMFGALVLALFGMEPARPRMQWLAASLLVLGVGALGFEYVFPLIDPTPSPNVSMYGSLFVRAVSTILVAIGLLPDRALILRRNTFLAIMVSGALVSLALISFGEHLPLLVQASDVQDIADSSVSRLFPGLTRWHLVIGMVPLLAGIVATWGAVRHFHDQVFGGWLVIGVTLLAGAQLHALFWPSMYSSALTTTSILRFALTVVIVVSGILELRYLSLERAALLADEQRRVQELEHLTELKRDFSSMVAHELATPLAAIGNLSRMISSDTLPPDGRIQAAARIERESRILQLLVKDIQASADVEPDDFTVDPKPVPVTSLLEDARDYAGTIQQNHPLAMDVPNGVMVMADPERIGQVIRNLLNNAIRHTPSGTPITLCATRTGDRIRIAVCDTGPGIDPADRNRILEKLGRGRGVSGEGRGLGLYLSRHILQAHGTTMTIESEAGRGACFSFDLREST